MNFKNYIFEITAISPVGFEDYRNYRDMEFSEHVYVYGLQRKNLNWKHEAIFRFKHTVFIFCGINVLWCLFL